ncbi:hypothetical protein ARMGADRAFT_857078, partial [Armillaria gallica]
QCLMEQHSVETAGDAMDIVSQIHNQYHSRMVACECTSCDYDWIVLHCEALHLCTEVAEKLLNCLVLKWDLRREDNVDGLELTDEQIEENQIAWENNDTLIFDPNIDQTSNLADAFCIFCPKTEVCPAPARRFTKPQPNDEGDTKIAYTNGSALHVGISNARVDAGIWYGHNNQKNQVIQIPGINQTNNTGEAQVI